MGLDHIRSEIEHMRVQVGRQRREMLLLQKAGISTASAEAMPERMLTRIDRLCEQRDQLKRELNGAGDRESPRGQMASRQGPR